MRFHNRIKLNLYIRSLLVICKEFLFDLKYKEDFLIDEITSNYSNNKAHLDVIKEIMQCKKTIIYDFF